MKFNSIFKREKRVRNYEGATAYKMSPEMELYSAVVTATLERLTYESGNKRLERIQRLVAKCDPVFVAKLAVYARTEMNLRSIPLVLVVELSKIHSGDDLVRRAVTRVIQRADELTEILAYYQMTNAREGTKKLNRLSKQLQKGIASSFNKFDEYQFAKYNRKTEVSLRDALFLTHPKAESESQQAVFDKIVNNSLQTPYTWEVELSEIGQKKGLTEQERQSAVKQKWEELIESKRLGYMATMRNLRNMLQAEVSAQHVKQVADYLSHPVAVERSRQLPFRFLSAYREVQKLSSPFAGYIMEALERAALQSAKNIQGFDLETRLVIACDVSGSMFQTVSANSKVMLYDVGLLLGMLLQNRSQNTVTGIFGDTWMEYPLPKSNILQNVETLKGIEGKVGYSTNGYKVLQKLNYSRRVVDKVMIFTDLQMWNSQYDGNTLQKEWNAYKRNIAPNAKLYLFDLAGYGQTPLRIEQNEVHLIAGWSDKIFDVLQALENGKKTLTAIRKVEI